MNVHALRERGVVLDERAEKAERLLERGGSKVTAWGLPMPTQWKVTMPHPGVSIRSEGQPLTAPGARTGMASASSTGAPMFTVAVKPPAKVPPVTDITRPPMAIRMFPEAL